MSTAHRPTWDPAQAKDVKGGSRQFSVRDMAAHTKLKFRCDQSVLRVPFSLSFPSQVGQTSADEIKKRDLRAELLAAEQEAVNKKRKAEGKPPLPIGNGIQNEKEDEESNKRRKLLQEAMELDKDEDGDDDDKPSDSKDKDDDEERYAAWFPGSPPCFLIGFPSEEDSDEDDDEDDTAALLQELAKIKRERAEEKARQEQEQSAADAATREAEIATANPLLNLAAALGQKPQGISTTAPGTFAVKKRWDDGSSNLPF